MTEMIGMEGMEEVFKALADGSRRRLLDRLHDDNGQSLRELCVGLQMSRQSVSKHLAILEAANLITSVRRGREKLHYLNAAPINDISQRWINRYDQPRVQLLSDLKTALEESLMDKPTFVYTTYIQTTPEKLWQALTDPEFTRRYWGVTFITDWSVGSGIAWQQFGVTVADPAQVILESDPYRRLAYSWHTFTPEFAAAVGFTEEFLTTVAAEPRSKVAFDLEPVGDSVRLTVTHDGFEEGSTVHASVSGGWPQILSSLKTLLETSAPLFEAGKPVPPGPR